MANEFEIKGLDGVLEKMRALGPKLAAKGARTAMRKAANVIKAAAVAKAEAFDRPETPQSIAKNIAIQFGSKEFKQTGDIVQRVGVRGGAKQYANTRDNRGKKRVGQSYATDGSTFYWRFREFGTSHEPARPFMLPSLTENVDTATEAAVGELNKQLDRLIAKNT